MRKSRFTASQIIKVLKEVEGGRQVGVVCREYGVSDATYYNWKAKCGESRQEELCLITLRIIERLSLGLEVSKFLTQILSGQSSSDCTHQYSYSITP